MSQRTKSAAPVIGRAPSLLEEIPDRKWERARKLASLLRPTLGKPLRRQQAERLAHAAKMSVANLRRYRRRLARNELTTSLIAGDAGFRKCPRHNKVIIFSSVLGGWCSSTLRESPPESD